MNYNPEWPTLFQVEADIVRTVLGRRALKLEHVGSTSVPGLVAKPILDILLVVIDSSDEDAYVPHLEAAGYVLRIREPEWHQHRMLTGQGTSLNLHVFSRSCREIGRVVAFRDRLRSNADDRDLYAKTKLDLAQRTWRHVQEYADAKTAVIEAILARAEGNST